MSDSYLQLRRIAFSGPKDKTELVFLPGVNVVCGASDTGKSFLAESIDFMLGGSKIRDISERTRYGDIALDLAVSDGEYWRLHRATSGGDFKLIDLSAVDANPRTLKQVHSHDKTDNLSGFLLEKIGLLGKRILKSRTKGTTQSLSFRNIARLIIVQEGEIQQVGSPFWGGQYTSKTAELATIKLLLTDVDDSDVVAAAPSEPDNARQIELIDELLSDLATEIADIGDNQEELAAQLARLDGAIEMQREALGAAQKQLDGLLSDRRDLIDSRREIQGRLDEIADLLARFDLLREHYTVDLGRLTAIRESGSMFAHVEPVPCPLCGAPPDARHLDKSCDGDVEAIVLAASAEIEKIQRLQAELEDTVADLESEASELAETLKARDAEYDSLNQQIQQSVVPEVGEVRASFSALVEERASAQRGLDLYVRLAKLEERRLALLTDEDDSAKSGKVSFGIPESVAHSFSLKVSTILKAWNFPGECLVHFDKETTDFVIDGKPRGSRGKGLRAITHAAVTIALLEYCQERGLSHPGFVVLDSPLLAYFKPEGDDDLALKGTDLKERFYEYLIEHHAAESQVLIIENQHPPLAVQTRLAMTVFTGNPNEGRFGFL